MNTIKLSETTLVPLTDTSVEIIGLVYDFFCKQDSATAKIKTAAWMRTKNLNLGDVSPADLIWRDRGHKVLAFVKNQLEGNIP